MHHLLACDSRFSVVALKHCVLPTAFLTLGQTVERRLAGRLPDTRRVDRIALSLETPQGDDFLLAGVSDLSIYHAYAFPENAERVFRRAILFEGVSRRERERWQQQYRQLLQRVAADTGRSLPLCRNASNTARIPLILDMFPRARFVHLSRHPVATYAAQQQRWRGLIQTWGLQDADEDRLRELTLLMYPLMMQRYLEDRERIPPGQLVDVKYEDLNKNPEPELKRVYEVLKLDGFAQIRSRMLETAARMANSLGGHDREPDVESTKRVARDWRFAFEPLGYRSPFAGQPDETPEADHCASDVPADPPCSLESGASTRADSIPTPKR